MASVIPEVSMLEIQKMQDGGYVVIDGGYRTGDFRAPRFASSTIDESLKYIKGKLEPKARAAM